MKAFGLLDPVNMIKSLPKALTVAAAMLSTSQAKSVGNGSSSNDVGNHQSGIVDNDRGAMFAGHDRPERSVSNNNPIRECASYLVENFGERYDFGAALAGGLGLGQNSTNSTVGSPYARNESENEGSISHGINKREAKKVTSDSKDVQPKIPKHLDNYFQIAQDKIWNIIDSAKLSYPGGGSVDEGALWAVFDKVMNKLAFPPEHSKEGLEEFLENTVPKILDNVLRQMGIVREI